MVERIPLTSADFPLNESLLFVTALKDSSVWDKSSCKAFNSSCRIINQSSFSFLRILFRHAMMLFEPLYFGWVLDNSSFTLPSWMNSLRMSSLLRTGCLNLEKMSKLFEILSKLWNTCIAKGSSSYHLPNSHLIQKSTAVSKQFWIKWELGKIFDPKIPFN